MHFSFRVKKENRLEHTEVKREERSPWLGRGGGTTGTSQGGGGEKDYVGLTAWEGSKLVVKTER